ncbi:MAG: EAL domain-containing protein [Pseudomonadota bacterium]
MESFSKPASDRIVRRWAWLGAVVWTLLVGVSLGWNIYRSRSEAMAMAYAEARAVRDKDMAFRRWGLKHSGVYVPVTEKEQPSPSLAHLPDRDLVTTDGRRLTLRAPATMVREMMDDYVRETGGARGRIVGLRTLNPANQPDEWEKRQLEAFELGEIDEVWEVADLDGQPHLRYLKAWFMGEGCVRCHGILGYKVGDMRGATGVNLPLAPYLAHADGVIRGLALSHGVFWFLGLAGIGWAGREVGQRAREREATLARIEHLARHDALTGLENRYSLLIRLDQAMATARRNESKLAVMLIDMDRFKNINDTLGHQVGDQMLVEVARRLKAEVRESDIVARLGGDEFVVVLTAIAASGDALAAGNKLLAVLAEPYRVDGQSLHSTPSIGVSLFPDNARNARELLSTADTAMYRAKAEGRNQLAFFTPELAEAAHHRLEIERELRHALASNGLTVVFQPQVEARSGRVHAFEALVRWPHPQRGWISPEDFIPVAEETGLIEAVGEWVLEQACAQVVAWRAAGFVGIRVAVNLSARQLAATTLVDRVWAIMERHAIAPGEIEIEVTESVVMADAEKAIERLQGLRALGLKIAIDDFGTGYSSLAYLKRLPLDVLKIDRAFVADIEHDGNDAAICAATIALAKSLGLAVVAEGVETEGQRAYLVGLGCDYLQGYLFARPGPAGVFTAMLRQVT